MTSKPLCSSYEPWICDYCTAGCTFEAMEWCAKRWNPEAECGHEKDQPLALDGKGNPSVDGCFEFVQLKKKVRYPGEMFSSLGEHFAALSTALPTIEHLELERLRTILEGESK